MEGLLGILGWCLKLSHFTNAKCPGFTLTVCGAYDTVLEEVSRIGTEPARGEEDKNRKIIKIKGGTGLYKQGINGRPIAVLQT